jgi:hypothetical protein
MGSTPKTLYRLMHLVATGALLPGTRVCDIGATQLFGDASGDSAAGFLDFFAEEYKTGTASAAVPKDRLTEIGDGGFLGDLLILAGFKYTAIDIFHATNTVLFDLNVHEPGPELTEQFDLVMNFGTTEHVFNQLRAFQSIHALTKVGGLCYHDLPLAGYPGHALYRYDPMFFTLLVQANNYDLVLHEITPGAERRMPDEYRQLGYTMPKVLDVGVEAVVRRTASDPFRIPLETTTSLSVDPAFETAQSSSLVRMPEGMSVHYGYTGSSKDVPFRELTSTWFRRLRLGIGRRLGR